MIYLVEILADNIRSAATERSNIRPDLGKLGRAKFTAAALTAGKLARDGFNTCDPASVFIDTKNGGCFPNRE